MGIFEKFKIGLNKSSKNLSEGFKNLVIDKNNLIRMNGPVSNIEKIKISI